MGSLGEAARAARTAKVSACLAVAGTLRTWHHQLN